jgi:DNA polymerase III delta prime subunit
MQFASSVSFTGTRKYVILDEADYLNPNSTQPALRNFMEEYSKNCGFILTCNFVNRIIEPLHSRCSIISFNFQKSDMPKIASQFFKRVLSILDNENVTYDKQVVAEVVNRFVPDWRRTLNELQRYSSTGSIDSGILGNVKEQPYKDLLMLMKDKNYTEMRSWVKENMETDAADMYNTFYTTASSSFTKNSIPSLVLLLAKYQYQSAFSANQEINFMAFLTECMIECQLS